MRQYNFPIWVVNSDRDLVALDSSTYTFIISFQCTNLYLGVLINVASAGDSTLFEVDEIVNTVSEAVDAEANIIFGSSIDPEVCHFIE